MFDFPAHQTCKACWNGILCFVTYNYAFSPPHIVHQVAHKWYVASCIHQSANTSVINAFTDRQPCYHALLCLEKGINLWTPSSIVVDFMNAWNDPFYVEMEIIISILCPIQDLCSLTSRMSISLVGERNLILVVTCFCVIAMDMFCLSIGKRTFLINDQIIWRLFFCFSW